MWWGKDESDANGFSVLEVIITLAVIAIPVSLNHQESARQSVVEESARNGLTAATVAFSLGNDYQEALSAMSSDNVELSLEETTIHEARDFCVTATWISGDNNNTARAGCIDSKDTPPSPTPTPDPTPTPSPPADEHDDGEWVGIPVGNGDWSSVTYGNVDGENVYIAVADQGDSRIMVSNDGVNWRGQDNPSVDNISWGNISYGIDENDDSVFVATPTQNSNRYMTSSDGENWELHSRGNGHLRFADLVYGNFYFMGISENTPLSFSPDGVNWETFSTTRYDPNAITVGRADDGQTKVLLIGNLSSSAGFAATVSLDSMVQGQNWNRATDVNDFDATAYPELQQAEYGDERFVVVSYEGVKTSTNGHQWEQLDAPFSGATALTYGDDNGFLVANGDRVWHSSDLGSWEEVVHQPGANFVDATFGDDCFVVVSDAGSDRVVTNCS